MAPILAQLVTKQPKLHKQLRHHTIVALAQCLVTAACHARYGKPSCMTMYNAMLAGHSWRQCRRTSAFLHFYRLIWPRAESRMLHYHLAVTGFPEGAGEYNLRLGITKELHPDMVATHQGELLYLRSLVEMLSV